MTNPTDPDHVLTLVMTKLLCTITTWRPELERAITAANLEPSVGNFAADLAAAITAMEGANHADHAG